MNNSSLWQDAVRRLIQNRAAMIGGITILVLIILAIFAPWIAPYSYSYQNLDIGASPPSAEHLLGTDVHQCPASALQRAEKLQYLNFDMNKSMEQSKVQIWQVL